MSDAPRLYPIMRFRDPDGMIRWLSQDLGFAELAVHRNSDGGVEHAELSLGPSILMIGPIRDQGGKAGVTTMPPYVAIDDPDALHAALTAKGVQIVDPLQDKDYGSRDFSCRDPEGNLWYFGTYRPAVA